MKSRSVWTSLWLAAIGACGMVACGEGTSSAVDSDVATSDLGVTPAQGHDSSSNMPRDSSPTSDSSHGSDAPASKSGSTPASALRGVYGFMVGMTYSASDTTIQGVMNNPDVDGVFIGFPWSEIAPSATTTDFSKIDAWLTAAASAKKKVSIGIEAGNGTPSWVGTGSDYVTITVYDYEQQRCQPNQRIPIPWHTSFLDAWTGLVKAFASHLDSEPSLYGTVSAIKVTGINDATYETSLPYEAASTHGSCTTTDDAEAWKAVGYTDALVESAWQTIIDQYATSFPDKALTMQYIDLGFPEEWVSGKFQPMNNDVSTALLDAGKATLGESRFVVEGTGLTTTSGPCTNLDNYATGGGTVGYQTLYYVYGDTSCTMDGHKPPCDESVLHTALEFGISHQMKYVELYHEDILGYPAEVTFAHNALAP
jgi:hypothetical protein